MQATLKGLGTRPVSGDAKTKSDEEIEVEPVYVDSHAHLTSPDVFEGIDALLTRAKEQKVAKIVNICTDRKSLDLGLELAKRYGWIYNTAATTPHDVEKEGETFFPFVEESARAGKLIAIGETGLDYHYTHSSVKIQKEFLLRYVELALSTHLPLVIHCREAFADLFALVDKQAKAVLHCFTGDLQEAKQALERGWYISFSGIVTFKKSEALRDVLRYVPLDRILVETDTPYLAPQSKRGKVNEPSFLPEIVALVAGLKERDLFETAAITSSNATAFFSF